MKALRIFGYVAWFLACFAVGIVLTFPVDDLRPVVVARLEQHLGKGQQGRNGVDPVVQIGSLSVSGFGVKARRVSVQFASTNPDPGPTLDVDSLRLSASLLSLPRKTKWIDVEAELAGGDVDAEIGIDDKGNVQGAEIDVDDVDLGKFPAAMAALGIPIGGIANASIDLDMGAAPEKDAKGRIHLDVKKLSLGPGNLKKIPGGFELADAIQLGTLVGEIPIKQGQGTVEKLHFEGATDVEAELAGTLTLKPKLTNSRLDLDGWFKPAAAFLDKNTKLKSALELGEKVGPLARAKDDEARYHFNVKGSLQAPAPALSREGGRKNVRRPTAGPRPSTAVPASEPTPAPALPTSPEAAPEPAPPPPSPEVPSEPAAGE